MGKTALYIADTIGLYAAATWHSVDGRELAKALQPVRVTGATLVIARLDKLGRYPAVAQARQVRTTLTAAAV